MASDREDGDGDVGGNEDSVEGDVRGSDHARGEGGSVCGGVLMIVMSLNMDIVGHGEERRMKIGVRALSPPLR